MNQPSTPGPHHLSTDEAVSRVVEWWNEGRPGSSRCDVVSGHAADEVLQEVHRRTPRSLLLDAAGRTPEEIVTEVLDFVGVPNAAQINTPWRHLRKFLRRHVHPAQERTPSRPDPAFGAAFAGMGRACRDTQPPA